MRLAAICLATALAIPALMPASARAGTSTAPAGATAGFANLKDGDTVTSPFTVKFTVTGLTVAPAGSTAPNTGHFHLLIDQPPQAPYAPGAIPKDAVHLHFGKGQTETSLTLKPGHHTLQVVMGDGLHQLHKPAVMSPVIGITVR